MARRHHHIYRYKLKAKELAASKIGNQRVLIINTGGERTMGIWVAALVLYFASLIYGILSLTLPPVKGNVQDTIPPGNPTALACNYSVTCQYAWNACILGDWNGSCNLNVTFTPTLDSRNCGLIVQEALNDPATLPESVVKFLNLYGKPAPQSPPPPTQQMSTAEMQQAVDFMCNLVFEYVRCTCTGCQVCPYPQAYCTQNPDFTAQQFCTVYTKMGFSDSPIYNGSTPYFQYPWQTPLDVQNQYMLVNPGYRN